MGSQSVTVKVTKQRNDLHSWQYPAHARKKKTKVEFRKTQENPRRYFEVKTSNKFVALETSEGSKKPKDQTANQRNAPKQKSKSFKANQGASSSHSPYRSLQHYTPTYFTLESLEEQFRIFHLTKYDKSLLR